MLVFDVSSDESFIYLDKWKKEIDAHRGPDSELLAIGNKNDLESERTVSVDNGEAWTLENDAFYLDFSAKCGSSLTIKSKLEEIANKIVLN